MFELKIIYFRRGKINYELRITNYELRITNYELRITNYEFTFYPLPLTLKQEIL